MKHDLLTGGITLKGESVKVADGSALAPSQASTRRDAVRTIPIREIELFLEIDR